MLEKDFQYEGIVDYIQLKKVRLKNAVVPVELFKDAEINGEFRGQREILYELVRDGIITEKQSASRIAQTEDGFKASMTEAGYRFRSGECTI